jgi:hypothetical protein
MSEEDLAREDEARTFASQGIDPLFNLAIASNDSEGAWSMVNTMMDRYLQFREQQSGLPPKGEPKEQIVYQRRPIVPKACKDGSISFEEKATSALIRRLNELLALKKLVLANHAMADRFNAQMTNLWPKVKKGVTEFLTPDQDLEGLRAYTQIPPTMVLERTIDIVAARAHADVVAASRKRLDAAKKVLGDDLKDRAKACWRTVKEPRPSPVQTTQDPARGGVLTTDPRVLHAQ